MAEPVVGDGRGPAAAPVEARIAWVERTLDLVALALGIALILLVPAATLTVFRPTLLVWAGIALLGPGLARDLAVIARTGRPIPVRTHGPAELRLCLESSLGVLAVAGGLAWRAWAAGTPGPVGLGTLVLGLGLVATFGQLTRHVIVAIRVEPGHRNLPFWS